MRLRVYKFWECPCNLLEYHFGEKDLTSHVKLVKLVGQIAIYTMCLQGTVLNQRLYRIKRYGS
jgi:hypothetical protein